MSRVLWWQHNSGLVFWTHAYTCSGHMFSPWPNSPQSFKSCACAKPVKLIHISSIPSPFEPMHPSHSYFWSGSKTLDWCDECITTNLLPQALSLFLVKFDKFHSGRLFPSVNISRYCIGQNQANPLEYMEVLIPDSRGSHHLPIWAASACRSMPQPLWWHHNSSIVFWPHALTSTQQC